MNYSWYPEIGLIIEFLTFTLGSCHPLEILLPAQRSPEEKKPLILKRTVVSPTPVQ